MLVAKRGLAVTVDADGLRIEHPAWDYAVQTSPAVVEILYRARVPVSREALADALPPAPGDALDRLVQLDILEESRAGGGDLPSPWNYWGAATWLFHARAHRTRFLHDRTEIWFEKVGREEPPPARVVRYADGETDVDLAGFHGESAIAGLFATRRTRREFEDRGLALAQVGELVSETFRVRDIADAEYFGRLPQKSYPSSGGRHEIDAYLVALNVLGIPRGIYYYDDYRDTLVDTSLGCDVGALEACLAGQGMTESSAALVVAVCDAERLAWKYRSPRGYLDTYVNVGHAMQNAVLYAESLGMGAWLTTALDTKAFSSLMSLEEDEFPMAVLALGSRRNPNEGPPV